MKLLLKLLEEIPFFWEFTPEERAVFADNDSFFASFKDGEYLIHEGSTDDALFILIQGRVAVTKESHPNNVIAVLDPGAVMGEISFLTHRQRSTNIVAQGEVTTFRVDGQTMEREGLDPVLQVKVKQQLIEIVVRRLEETNQALVRQKEMNHALAKALHKKAFGG
ncbi:MAG: cyclic nucleotide-binding domain-containing protein [Magnetococcales bacterium]|nr:cyclic nucleotide-binding domain-containing protein [Magnetococcales bacterium]MBF0155847.1 cyclic nucleotide-binding domain-containing protein [Magnetococcales bacterium]